MDDAKQWEADAEEDYGLDITGVDTTDISIEVKPSYPSSMKFDGYEMSMFSFLLIIITFLKLGF